VSQSVNLDPESSATNRGDRKAIFTGLRQGNGYGNNTGPRQRPQPTTGHAELEARANDYGKGYGYGNNGPRPRPHYKATVSWHLFQTLLFNAKIALPIRYANLGI
jgi:hypothetical protein